MPVLSGGADGMMGTGETNTSAERVGGGETVFRVQTEEKSCYNDASHAARDRVIMWMWKKATQAKTSEEESSFPFVVLLSRGDLGRATSM